MCATDSRYEDFDALSAELLAKLDNELQTVRVALLQRFPQLDLSPVLPVKERIIKIYGKDVADTSSLLSVVRTNKGYQVGFSVAVAAGEAAASARAPHIHISTPSLACHRLFRARFDLNRHGNCFTCACQRLRARTLVAGVHDAVSGGGRVRVRPIRTRRRLAAVLGGHPVWPLHPQTPRRDAREPAGEWTAGSARVCVSEALRCLLCARLGNIE